MRAITGAILILTAEQAFAHAHLVGFPHQVYVQSILLPSAAVLSAIGAVVLIWGIFSERKST